MKHTFIVESRDQLIAALLCACHTTHALAKQNPFDVLFADTNFSLTFREGLHEKRVEQLARRIKSIDKNTFI